MAGLAAAGAHEFAFDFVEDAVDEFAAVFGGEFFGDIDGFVDADDRGDILPIEHFEDGEAHDVAIDGGDAVEIPVFGVFFDLLVDLGLMLEDAADEGLGEEPGFGLVGGGRGEFDLLAPSGGAFVFLNGGGPLGIPEGGELQLEVFGRVEVVLEQELDRAFAGFASFAHKSGA